MERSLSNLRNMSGKAGDTGKVELTLEAWGCVKESMGYGDVE